MIVGLFVEHWGAFQGTIATGSAADHGAPARSNRFPVGPAPGARIHNHSHLDSAS